MSNLLKASLLAVLLLGAWVAPAAGSVGFEERRERGEDRRADRREERQDRREDRQHRREDRRDDRREARDERREQRRRGDAQAAARTAQRMNGGGRVLSVSPEGDGYQVRLLKDGEVRSYLITED